MARPKRQEDWIPITARVSTDSARRLRVNAARRGIPPGQVLDEIIQASLPPDPIPMPPGKVPRLRKTPEPWTVDGLATEMEKLGLSQAALSRELKLSQKAVNAWFLRGQIPPLRQAELHRVMSRLKAERR